MVSIEILTVLLNGMFLDAGKFPHASGLIGTYL